METERGESVCATGSVPMATRAVVQGRIVSLDDTGNEMLNAMKLIIFHLYFYPSLHVIRMLIFWQYSHDMARQIYNQFFHAMGAWKWGGKPKTCYTLQIGSPFLFFLQVLTYFSLPICAGDWISVETWMVAHDWTDLTSIPIEGNIIAALWKRREKRAREMEMCCIII